MNTIKNNYNKGKNTLSRKNNERKVKNEEKIRQRTENYRFRVIKKLKKLYDLCLEEDYQYELREKYVKTLNDILINKIIALNSSIEIFFRFTLDLEKANESFVNPFVVFVNNSIIHYDLKELKCIDHYVTKFLN
jgi:hypothetical protein